MEELLVKIENAGAKAGTGGSNGGSSGSDEQPKSFFNKMGGAVKTGLKGAGIQFGVASLLKQSQLFTSFAGSIFQIVGGMVDLMLAPLMPIFIPVLKFLAKMMPGVQTTSKWIADKILTISESIGSFWKDNTPSWMQGGDGTQIAQVLGGVVTALVFTKFTGVWKLAKWFGGVQVGQKVATTAGKAAAKSSTKTISSVIRGKIGDFIKYLGSGFKALMFKIPGVESLVKGIGKLKILITSWASSAIKNVKSSLKNAVKGIGEHIFKGSSKVTSWLGKKFMAPFKWVGDKVGGLLKGPFTRMKNIFNTIGKFINRGPIKTVTTWLGKIMGNVLKFLKSGPKNILTGIAKVLLKVLATPFTLLAKALNKIPGLGGLAKGVSKIFSGGAGALLGKIGGKAGLKAAGMSIPGVGAAIGLAAGAYETQRMVRKYGFNAKTVGAGLAYTTAQTAAGAAGGPVGIAAAIAGEVALHQFENRVLKVEVTGPDEQAKVSAQTQDGKNQAMQQTAIASDYAYTG